jgi:CO dehydrogenase/acetyl-CoA synthase alpha subunit
MTQPTNTTESRFEKIKMFFEVYDYFMGKMRKLDFFDYLSDEELEILNSGEEVIRDMQKAYKQDLKEVLEEAKTLQSGTKVNGYPVIMIKHLEHLINKRVGGEG